MTWHPATGLGVIALGQPPLRAGSPAAPASALEALVRDGRRPRGGVPLVLPAVDAASRPSPRACSPPGTTPSPTRAFAMNMDLDEPRDTAGGGREGAPPTSARSGATRPRRPCPGRPRTCAGGCAASVAGSQLEILVTPEPEPRIQTFRVTPRRGPVGGALAGGRAAAGRRGGAGTAAWPADLPYAGTLDPEAVGRTLRAGAARFGRCGLGLPDRWRRPDDDRPGTLATARGRATLRVALDPETGAVTEAALPWRPATRRTTPGRSRR